MMQVNRTKFGHTSVRAFCSSKETQESYNDDGPESQIEITFITE